MQILQLKTKLKIDKTIIILNNSKEIGEQFLLTIKI